MGPICRLKSSCSSSCCYPVISLFSFPPRVHTQGSQVSAAFREASSHGLIVARIWVFSDDENRPFRFSPSFHSQQIPKVAYYQAYSSARRGGASAGGLLYLCPGICLHSAWPPSLFSCRRVVISSPCFFSLSTIPIVHLSTLLSLGRHTHFLTQACRNQAFSTTPIFLSFILRMYHIQNSIRPTSYLLRMPHIQNPVRPTFHLLRMPHIRNSVRRHSTFFGCLTSGILYARHSTSFGCLTSGILSVDVPPSPDASHPKFCPSTSHLLRMSHIRHLTPDGRGGRFNFPHQTCPDPRFMTSFFKPFQSILSFILRVFKITQESHFQ